MKFRHFRIAQLFCSACLLLLSTAAVGASALDDGKAAYAAADYKTAIEKWEILIREGSADGLYFLGVMYSQGKGIAQDKVRAFQLYREAAQKNHVAAQYNVGMQYATGDGVLQDFRMAEYWWVKAAQSGLMPAQFNLGSLYYFGMTGEKNLAEARKWLTLAADQGSPHAKETLAKLDSEDPRRPRPSAQVAAPTTARATPQASARATPLQIAPATALSTPSASAQTIPHPSAPPAAQISAAPATQVIVSPSAAEPESPVIQPTRPPVAQVTRPPVAQVAAPPIAQAAAPPSAVASESPVAQPTTPPVAQVAAPPIAQAAAPPIAKIAAPAIVQVPAPVTTPRTSGDALRREAWILTQPPDFYTIQILAVGSEPAVREHIMRQGLSANAAYLESPVPGASVFRVIYGSYPNRELATRAMATLPRASTSGAPWVRRFSDVQALVDRRFAQRGAPYNPSETLSLTLDPSPGGTREHLKRSRGK